MQGAELVESPAGRYWLAVTVDDGPSCWLAWCALVEYLRQGAAEEHDERSERPAAVGEPPATGR